PHSTTPRPSLHASRPPRHLHSFPTRRSSDLFLYHGADDRPGTLLHDLPELLRDSRVNVLVSLREDALAQLDVFKARIPAVFSNQDRKSTRLNSSHLGISYAVFCLKKKKRL